MGIIIEYCSVLGGTAVLTNKYLGTMKDGWTSLFNIKNWTGNKKSQIVQVICDKWSYIFIFNVFFN